MSQIALCTNATCPVVSYSVMSNTNPSTLCPNCAFAPSGMTKLVAP